jgi:hypothetical protein
MVWDGGKVISSAGAFSKSKAPRIEFFDGEIPVLKSRQGELF